MELLSSTLQFYHIFINMLFIKYIYFTTCNACLRPKYSENNKKIESHQGWAIFPLRQCWLIMTSSNGTFSPLVFPCEGKSLVTREFPAQRQVKRSFDVFFNLRMNKQLSKQSWGWWFETPSCSLWRHCIVFQEQLISRKCVLLPDHDCMTFHLLTIKDSHKGEPFFKNDRTVGISCVSLYKRNLSKSCRKLGLM